MEPTDKPLAAKGLTSYRYAGRYGWIMIGATDIADAIKEAYRSTGIVGHPTMNKLQVWKDGKYQNVPF